MNLSTQWIAVLEAAGIAAVHWSSLGEITAADDEIMLYAPGRLRGADQRS